MDGSLLAREKWSGAVRRLIAVHPVLVAAIDPILVARDPRSDDFARLGKLAREQARDDVVHRRLMTTPGVCAVVTLTYVAAINDAARSNAARRRVAPEQLARPGSFDAPCSYGVRPFWFQKLPTVLHAGDE